MTVVPNGLVVIKLHCTRHTYIINTPLNNHLDGGDFCYGKLFLNEAGFRLTNTEMLTKNMLTNVCL